MVPFWIEIVVNDFCLLLHTYRVGEEEGGMDGEREEWREGREVWKARDGEESEGREGGLGVSLAQEDGCTCKP